MTPHRQLFACRWLFGRVVSAAFRMIYPTWLTLKLTMCSVGALLLLAHLFALFSGKALQAWLRTFPRSREAGVLLTIAAATWFYFLVTMMDLGEFSPWRDTVRWLTPIAGVLSILYMRDFLAVRALGTLALLLAQPLLESAFLREENSRLLLVVLTYVWIVAGMFWVGMPYTLRDQIGWVTASEARWKGATFAGLGYGAAMLAAGLFLA